MFGPAVVEALNGPSPEASEDRPYQPLGAPAGFQVIEGALFPGGDDPGRDSLRATVRAMRASVAALRGMTDRVQVTDAAVLDALRLEMARISTLGIAGFDAPLSGDDVVESTAALDGARAVVQAAVADGAGVRWSAVDSALGRAADYLRVHASRDSLDPLTFIVGYADPAARVVADARRALPPPLPLRRLWRQGAASLFERDAFDASAYAPMDAPPASGALIALGRRLFSEPALSGPGTRACAFCHDPGRAFTDGRARSALLTRPGGAHRNTPTLLNAGYAPALFDDLRARSLEAQAGIVLAAPAEMGGSPGLVVARLREDPTYRAAFARAFSGDPGSAITARRLLLALGAYVRSLSALDSRFDRAVRGDTAAVSSTERLGFRVFMGKARCATCHFLPLFNGTMPPDFVTSEAEIIGTPDRTGGPHPRLDADPGLAGVDAQPAHRGAFKVPTLRNVALTAPYMHDGAFRTLEEVVDFYDHGGGAGSGLDVPDQTLLPVPLHLSSEEKGALVAFLRALTDTVWASTPSSASRDPDCTLLGGPEDIRPLAVRRPATVPDDPALEDIGREARGNPRLEGLRRDHVGITGASFEGRPSSEHDTVECRERAARSGKPSRRRCPQRPSKHAARHFPLGVAYPLECRGDRGRR
jgi:cytochrome c peroxidase